MLNCESFANAFEPAPAARGEIGPRDAVVCVGTGSGFNNGTRFLSDDVGSLFTSVVQSGVNETIGDSFEDYVAHAYKANGVVFTCVLVRMMPFSEARLLHQEMNNGRPGDYYWSEALAPLESPREFALMARLADYPEVLAGAAEELAPHALAFWLKDLAAEFHGYYNAERFLVDDAALRSARLALLRAVRQVLRNGLGLIGVSAPERM